MTIEKTAASKTPAPKKAKEFSIDNWLLDAELPQESADVYKAGGVPAKASAMKRRIDQFRRSETAERSANEVDEYLKLEKEYTDLLQDWADSRITVFVSAVPVERLQELRAENEAATEGMSTDASNELFGYAILCEAIVGIAEAGVAYGDASYSPVKLEMRQLRALERKIGPLQMQKIMDARRTAQMALPSVDADFLQGNSGSTGDTTAS